MRAGVPTGSSGVPEATPSSANDANIVDSYEWIRIHLVSYGQIATHAILTRARILTYFDLLSLQWLQCLATTIAVFPVQTLQWLQCFRFKPCNGCSVSGSNPEMLAVFPVHIPQFRHVDSYS